MTSWRTKMDDKLTVFGDRRNPEIQSLIDYFEHSFGFKMPRAQFQRRAAKTLIQRVGLTAAIHMVDAAKLVYGKEYAPVIVSLEDLRDKWPKLRAYYDRRKAKVSAAAVIHQSVVGHE